MGNIQTLKDTGDTNQITSSMDGAVYRSAVGSMICEGIGDEFALTYNATSLTVSFNAGSECVICGNFFKVKATTSITLPASSTIYLCARIDTSQASGSTGSFQALTSAQITNGNINGNDSTCDLLLYVITTNASGVTGVVDRRCIRGDGIGGITTGTLTAGQTSITITDARIDSNSAISVFVDNSHYGVNPETITVNTGNVVLTFDEQETDMVVGVKLEGRY